MRKLGISLKQLSDIVNCRSGISPDIAIRLYKAFGGVAIEYPVGKGARTVNGA